MSFVHCWKLVCDCEAELELGFDTVTNFSFPDFFEMVEFGRAIGLLYPPAAHIETFFKAHQTHHLERRISENELSQESKSFAILFSCSCGQVSVSSIATHLEKELPEQPFTAEMLEKYYRMLELYNLLGCLFDNHSWSDALESQLPFLKKHVHHGVKYGIIKLNEKK